MASLSGRNNERLRLVATSITPKPVIAAIIQVTRITRIHNLQNGGGFPQHLPLTL
jgi:hypothetical protein